MLHDCYRKWNKRIAFPWFSMVTCTPMMWWIIRLAFQIWWRKVKLRVLMIRNVIASVEKPITTGKAALNFMYTSITDHNESTKSSFTVSELSMSDCTLVFCDNDIYSQYLRPALPVGLWQPFHWYRHPWLLVLPSGWIAQFDQYPAPR